MNNKRQSIKSPGLIFVCKSVKVCAPHMWGDSSVSSASNDWHHQSVWFSVRKTWSFWLWSADWLGQSHNRHRLAIKIHLAGNVCMLRINVLLDILLIYGLSTYGAMTPIVYLICEIPQTQLKLKVSLSASQCACTVEIGALLVCIFLHTAVIYMHF